MAEVEGRTTFESGIVRGGSNPSGVLFVDSSSLINFDRIGQLPALPGR
jgi:hypothetical protein